MKALLAGYGGIGSSVYYPELKKLGFDIDIIDLIVPETKYKTVYEIEGNYDLGIVCTPNFTHGEIAWVMAGRGVKRVFVDKPGLKNETEWFNLLKAHPKTEFHLVKNNLYRNDYASLLYYLKTMKLIGVDINWLNNNRIPNPGGWFTDKSRAFGGVSRDLMPHLYCFAYKIFGEEWIDKEYNQISLQRWSLDQINNTEYGIVKKDGIYNVDDFAMATFNLNGISVKLTASWKEGYDKQSITLYFDDGTNYEWNFGLCPSEAYGIMLQDTKSSYEIDLHIHSFLENFDGN